ncbi:hypothetical protein ACOMHN_000287 [Nucella lapillus]
MPGILPMGHHASLELQRELQHSLSLQISHGLMHGQHSQLHPQHHQHQHVRTSQTSHQHRPQQPSHLQSIMNQPRPEPLSPQHHQISHSPHPHPQPSVSPHPHQQSSLQQQLKHPSLSVSHGLELDRQNPSVSQTAPSTSASSLQLHSQGVNTSESAADIASSSQRAHLCTTCLKGFRTKQQLIQHSLVHSNVRKYTCTYCDRTFKQLSHLQQHTRIHTGEKPYACRYEDCDRAFAQMSNLQHHMRNHEEQVKKEVLRIYKCDICHRSYTNEGSLKTHTMKMHMHVKLPDDLSPEDQPMKKRKKKKNRHLSTAPTMVPLGMGESSSRRDGTDISSDEDFVGNRREHSLPSMGSIPRNLVESLNQYERALAAGMNGDKGHGGNLTSCQSGLHQEMGEGSRDRDSAQASTSLGLMGLPGVDSAFMSGQHPEVVERVAAAAAAAVSNQLLQQSSGSGGHSTLGHSTTTSSSLSNFQPHPQPAHSQIMDTHLRNQVNPLALPPLHDQFYAHGGAPLSMLSPHAHLLGPPRSMADLPMTYGSQISSASSLVTTAHLTAPSAPHTNSRPSSVLASPHHVPEALNFNH